MMEIDHQRNSYVQLIEGQEIINGRFAEVRRIDPIAGSGDFSLVFEAIDNYTNRKVALKFFNPLCTADKYRESCFNRESEILESLIGQRDILQLVQARDQLVLQLTESIARITVSVNLSFFVTELADSDVLEYIYSDDVKPLRSLRFFRAMCRGVQRIHSCHICHRDIKPENFFRFGPNEIHLGDFGTARAMVDVSPPLLPEYRGWRGDKRYTAPEQCVSMNETPTLFYIGDMYSLGAMLFEMFTKQPLFLHIFDDSFHYQLAAHFMLIRPERRELTFTELLPDIVRSRSLPNIYDFDTQIPSCIKVRLDRLYKRLACLDYRNRARYFVEIFHEINMCTQILENETAYRRMIQFRRKVQEEKKERNEQARWNLLGEITS